MQYVYPKLSSIDLSVTRIGGLGLGNMLFTYARALLYARDHGAQLIWPTWNSIPVGQILRREENKRFYNDLFTLQYIREHAEREKQPEICSGFKKVWVRCTRKKVQESYLLQHEMTDASLAGKMIEFTGMEGEFAPLYGRENSQYIYGHMKKILQEENQKALHFVPGEAICMHVRLGDFGKASQQGQQDGSWEKALQSGTPNLSIPITWYCNIVKQIREAAGYEVPVYLFSDGTDQELKELLEMPYVSRKTFGTAIADIMAMAQSKVFIASGSTFSRWVRYLGRMNTITYLGQLGQRLLEEDENQVELEAVDQISEEVMRKIVEDLKQ